jgi:predicted enzyme related to lactoylglutathione lyase
MASLFAYLSYRDAAAATRLLEAIGFRVVTRQPGDDGSVLHTELRLGDAVIMLANADYAVPPLAGRSTGSSGAALVCRQPEKRRGAAMPERNGYIPGVPCWVDTGQPDPEAVLDFYSGLFGWEFENVMPPGAGGKYFLARLRGSEVAAVGSLPEALPQIATWGTYVWVESADDTASKVRAAGGGVVMEPFDIMDFGRMAYLTDPEGAAFSVWQAKEHRGARIVNEHGSVNFNGLHTRDIEGAKSFYGSVFGWTTLALGAGEMWTLPGYGDYLERDNPDLRKQLAEMGGPGGFEDVVASLNPIPADQTDTPAHWSVTFGVDDANATAEKATELGGTVIAPPFDAPWSRLTIVGDPQGATFIASQFVPENKDLAG